MASEERADTSHVTARKLPKVTRRLSEDTRWEVRAGDRVIGWIEERHLGKGHTLFYFAVGVHPETGREYRLEGSTDFDDRVNVVADFYRDPMTHRQHLGIYSGSEQG